MEQAECVFILCNKVVTAVQNCDAAIVIFTLQDSLEAKEMDAGTIFRAMTIKKYFCNCFLFTHLHLESRS